MERISPITGKPVRKYTKTIKEVLKDNPKPKEEKCIYLKKETFINKDNFTNRYTLQVGKSWDAFEISITRYVTNNCQLMSIGNFQELLKKAEDLIEELKVIKSVIRKNIALVDIKEDFISLLKEKIPTDMIIMISPYTSTTGSKMNICLINIKNL